MEKIIECDLEYIEGYRNKVEFTIGREFIDPSREGPLCIGFNVGNQSKGIIFAGRPDNIKVISNESKIVAKIMENIVVKFNI